MFNVGCSHEGNDGQDLEEENCAAAAEEYRRILTESVYNAGGLANGVDGWVKTNLSLSLVLWCFQSADGSLVGRTIFFAGDSVHHNPQTSRGQISPLVRCDQRFISAGPS